MAVTWPLPVDFVTGPAFTLAQLSAVQAAADAAYPQFRFKPEALATVVYTAAESDALGAGWTNYPQYE